MKTSKLNYVVSDNYFQYRDDILSFWRRVNGDSRQECFDSAYESNPLGNPTLGLCFDGDKLVGTENYLRQDISFQGKFYSGALGADTLVDPNYRIFYGAFGGLCKITHDALKDKADILFAAPNEISQGYYLKYFDWTVAAEISIFKKVVSAAWFSPRKILSLFRPGKQTAEFEMQRVERFDDTEIDSVIAANAQLSKNAYFHKSARYLDWKFLNHRHYDAAGFIFYNDGVLVGYCITLDQEKERRILDLQIANDSARMFDLAISTLVRCARLDGMEIVSIDATQTAWYRSILRKHFFLERYRYDYVIRSSNEVFKDADWIIHKGDFDVF